MSEVEGSKSWQEELASLIDDTGMRYTHSSDAAGASSFPSEVTKPENLKVEDVKDDHESLKVQITEFAKAWGEILVEMMKGCRDIAQQSILTEDSFVVRHGAKFSSKLRFLNDYLPEDKDPAHAWSVIFFVFILTIAVLTVTTRTGTPVPPMQKVLIHPVSATRVLLPDGRHMAYHEQGVSGESARFSMVGAHPFLSSRLAGIPGVKPSLLEEFGVRLITYDLPGFGESDPHPTRSLNSSALDMLILADALNISDKFWVLGFSSGSIHAWAALKYIPNRIAGVVMFAPMANPYDSGMSKGEASKIWETWGSRRKLMYFLARRFPRLLGYFYRRSFLNGRHGPIEEWLSISLRGKDKYLVENAVFKEFWHRDVEESLRQGTVKHFVEETVLQVSSWGFSLRDLQLREICRGKSFFPWLKLIYRQVECALTGYQGPIHIWQGMDDMLVPPSTADYIARILPNAIPHKLGDEGHFSYYYHCDECHKQIFHTLFGLPEGPLQLIEDHPISLEDENTELEDNPAQEDQVV